LACFFCVVILNAKLIKCLGNTYRRPYFNINAPANISHYELLIGDENDEYVEQVEVYNREQEIIEMPWQYPSQNIENGLYPGMVYYWKLLMFDGSGNLLFVQNISFTHNTGDKVIVKYIVEV
jgi:hypothetical protein